MTKKQYDWAGVKALPLGTKFRLPVWSNGNSYSFARNVSGHVELIENSDKRIITPMTLTFFMLQDTFEVVDCKHDFDAFKYEKGAVRECYICGEKERDGDCKHDNIKIKAQNIYKELLEAQRYMSDAGKYIPLVDVGCDICGVILQLSALFPQEEKPFRQHVTLGEALANVATGKWERAAYDSDEWLKKYEHISIDECGCLGVLDSGLEDACSELYQDARWYNPDGGV